MMTKKLEFLKREGDSEKNNVILLHGYGADNQDLFGLADFLDPEGEWSFYFPQAPIEVPIGPAWMGRAWFPIPQRDLEVGIDYSHKRPPGIDAAAQAVGDLIFDLNSERLVLGGFSQGAMMAVDVAMNNANDVEAMILLSGTLVDRGGWTAKAGGLKGKKFFQSHGLSDTVIPVAKGQALFDLLKAAGLEGGLHTFPGGHEIPMPVLNKAKQFLSGLVLGDSKGE